MPVSSKYPDIRHFINLLLANLQLELLNIVSNVYLIPFCKAPICLHIAIVQACIINNNINTVGTSNGGCEKGAMGVIHSRKPATLLPPPKCKLANR